ncbi:hypothetical protein ABIF07_003600 [Bradyrhizobium elkanii]|uniref:hypothetical protein n=1 Tax=Bradyrhizobium elkanii TaxID=29448 RepID=UPI0035161655|nr:hypothetical protein [Bradyrhizobium elkanii]
MIWREWGRRAGQNEDTRKSIASDGDRVLRAIKCMTDAERNAPRIVLTRYFFEDKDGWRHKRIDRDLEKHRQHSERKKRPPASPLMHVGPMMPHAMRHAFHRQCLTNANHPNIHIHLYLRRINLLRLEGEVWRGSLMSFL